MSTQRTYGALPTSLGSFPIECKEAMFCLYMPISLAGSTAIVMPKQFQHYFYELVTAVRNDVGWSAFAEHNIYLTAKHTFVSPSLTANRPGWHSDGFLTDDLNYLWYDALPTIFNDSDFVVDPDHERSLDQFWAQADPERDIQYDCCELLKLDQFVIHSVADAMGPMFRTFVKISVSKDRYNLSGNTHNYDLDYDWPMHDRLEVRNTPAVAQRDAIAK